MGVVGQDDEIGELAIGDGAQERTDEAFAGADAARGRALLEHLAGVEPAAALARAQREMPGSGAHASPCYRAGHGVTGEWMAARGPGATSRNT